MIDFILGKGNLDASEKVREMVAELAKTSQPLDKIFYIIPDQFESETEFAVYEKFKEKGISGKTGSINITTFSALAEKLLSENGDDRPCADDIVKSVVMHKAVSELGGSLSTLKSISDKQGFCEKITETVSVFKSAGLNTDMLEKRLEAFENSDNEIKNTALFKKLGDVAKIYAHYDKILGEKNYIDRLDMIGQSAGLIKKSGLFKDAEIFADCFNDFTNDQLRFLCEVIPQAKNMKFAFVTDYDSDHDVFKTANSHITRLKSCAEKNGIEYKITAIDCRSENSPLINITNNLYQDAPESPQKTDSCELVSAPDIFGELDFVCAKIKELVETGDIRYNNIAVLSTDLSGSGRYIESAFKKYDIPFFLDMRESILRQPLVNAVLALINALRGFSLESVLSCIKTGFFTKLNDKNEREGIDEHEIGVFEDYIFEWDLGTAHLQKPFAFKNPETETDKNAETAENIRMSVAQPLYDFYKKLKRKKKLDGADLTKQIYEYLINTVDIECEIQAKCLDPTSKEINSNTTMMYQQLWDTLIKIFNALYKELAGVNLTIDQYYNIFRDVCLSTTLASPPQLVDSVLVGDIDRTRAANIKAAFIIEASFDSFPAPLVNLGIFSQYETDIIQNTIFGDDKSGDEAAPVISLNSSLHQYQLSLYRAYRAVCLPSNYLCVSYSESSPSGEPMQISTVSDELNKLFETSGGESIIKKTSDFDDSFYCRSVNSAKLRFALGINSGSRENEILKRALSLQSDDCKNFTERLLELKGERNSEDEKTVKHKISPETAKLLFPVSFGATTVEEIAKCKFSYFCKFALKADERRRRAFTAAKRGDAVHFVLQQIIELFKGDINKFCSLSRGALYSLAKEQIKKFCALETNIQDPLSDSRTNFLFTNIANAATDTLISMQMEFRSRKYRPQLTELNLKKTDTVKLFNNFDAVTSDLPEIKLYDNEGIIPDNIAQAKESDDLTLGVAPLSLALDNGTNVKIHGRIDRLDMFKENDKIYVRVVDYKTSPHSIDLSCAKQGINIQMLMYLSALLDANKGKEIVAGGINYIPTKNKGASDSPVDPAQLIAMNYFSSGLLVVDDVTEADYENYKKFIVDRIPEDGGEREKTKVLLEHTSFETVNNHPTKSASRGEFGKMMTSVFDGVKNRFTDIYDGVVDAIPLIYKEYPVNESAVTRNSCEYCRFKSICKNNGNITNDISQIDSAKKKSDTEKG